MLRTAKADTLCAQFSCLCSVSWSICIGADSQSSIFVSPCHDAAELACDGSIYRRNNAVIDLTGRTVDRQPVALMVLFSGQNELLVCLVHDNLGTAGYTAGTHTAGNYSCVAGHTAADCQDTLRSLHSFDIFRRCLKTY